MFIDPPTVQSQGAFGSPVPLLCSAVRCLQCGETILRKHWRGWRCERCDVSSCRLRAAAAYGTDCGAQLDHKALPLLVTRDVDFGRMRIEYSGPRMDNGRATWQSGVDVQRTLQIWPDHVKSARYEIKIAAQRADETQSKTRLWHLLSSGHVKAQADDLLVKLLRERMPYRRVLLDGTLSPYFALAFHGLQERRTESFLRIPYRPLDKIYGVFLDTVHAVDEMSGRFLSDEQSTAGRAPYNEASFLVIAGTNQDVPLRSCVGSIAQSV